MGQPQAPVVLIPGFLGSKLGDDQGLVWGEFLSMIRRFDELALPADPAGTTLRPAGLLDSVQILGPFRIGQYQDGLDWFRSAGFVDGTSLFVFDYDWRRSNFESAKRLREFVDSQPALAAGRFNIVAHSMGGLIARIYIHREGGASRVGKLVTVGTPHLGSVEAVRAVLEGWGAKSAFLGGRERVREVMLSFRSLWELLPTYSNCCIEGRRGASDNQPIDALDFDTYARLRWLPPSWRGQPARRAFIEAALTRARELRQLTSAPLPAPLEGFMIAGAVIQTRAQVFYEPVEGKPDYRKRPGDGTVYPQSAANGDLEHALAAIHQHSTLLSNQQVQEQLRNILVTPEDLRPFSFSNVSGKARDRSGAEVGVKAVEVLVDPSVSAKGQPTLARVRVYGATMQLVSNIPVRAWLGSDAGEPSELPVAETEEGEHFAVFAAPTSPGVHPLVAEVPGLGQFTEYFVVAPPEQP
jgi:pimeloyl-ACP methyl ester carboxylesterase